jgi:Zn-dependent membrane protease YugP
MYILFMIPPLLLSLYASWKVKHTFAKYSEVGTRSGLTGAEAAARVLSDSGIAVTGNVEGYPKAQACSIEATHGYLSDHYDPSAQALRLSEPVFGGRSVAALGVAAHEAGHAIQHAQGYKPLALRSLVVPITGIGSNLAWPIFFIGLILNSMPLGGILQQVGIAMFSFVVLFTLVTLPVEFNASKRALLALSNGGYLTQDEMFGARKVLNAAAMTYVAAAASAVMTLVYMLLRSRD